MVETPKNEVSLPASTTILVLGILSLIFPFAAFPLVLIFSAGGERLMVFGFLSISSPFLGLILGIVCQSISSRTKRQYRQDQSHYSLSSYSNTIVGRTCAIIGICISG
ncbi:MAG: hypothetical protein RLZZ165_1609, partial [Bacteroidota bacterium]